MMRLVKAGLMYGNLTEIKSQALVERYNRALKHLIGKTTALTEFHIDISGFSPEIGHEFGDDLYLNPQGCNRMFILLTTDQKRSPLLNSHFSTSRSILRNYIEENEEQLFALTAREAVAGEMLNSVFSMETPSDLLMINQVDIEADTIDDHVAEAAILGEHIDQFLGEPDAWWDDVLIADMIELAKRTGNIQRNPVALTTQSYRQKNFYTNHFGGVYVFRGTDRPTIIARNSFDGLDKLEIDNILTFDERDAIGDFLREERLSELIMQRRDDKSAAIIRQKLDFIAISTAANKGDNLSRVTRRHMRSLERRYSGDLPAEYFGLMQIWRWAKYGGENPKIDPDHPAYFYALRASQHDDRDLVNMLLSDLSRLDFRQLFICHKSLFYDAYGGWTEAKKNYVVKFIASEYAVDKAGARETLFGKEPSMDGYENEQEPRNEPKANPWGKRAPARNKKTPARRSRSEGWGSLREELGWDRKEYAKKHRRRRRRDDDDEDD